MRCGDIGIFVVLFVGFWIVLSKNGGADCAGKLFLHARRAFYDSTIYYNNLPSTTLVSTAMQGGAKTLPHLLQAAYSDSTGL